MGIFRNVVAWTGGSDARPIDQVSPEERHCIRSLFRRQCYLFKDFWETGQTTTR
jgi:hypothetical protein